MTLRLHDSGPSIRKIKLVEPLRESALPFFSELLTSGMERSSSDLRCGTNLLSLSASTSHFPIKISIILNWSPLKFQNLNSKICQI